MKKIQVVIISLLFFITNIQADFLFNAPNPYSFGPQGRSVSDLRNFATPKQMVRILPNMPVVATDSSGSRVYYSPDGKMMFSVAKDGSMSCSLGGTTKNYNSNGEFTGTTKTIKGSGLLQEVKNEKGEVLSYRALNGDGKTAATYDKDMNLTATYVYTGQGAMLDYVQNEMTGGRTYYDELGRTMKDVDFDGYILRTYQYEDVVYEIDETDPSRKTLRAIKKEGDVGTGLLVSTRDYGYHVEGIDTENGTVENRFVYTTTYFDKEGKTLYVKNYSGFITDEYHYKNDDKGNKILDFVINNTTKQKTYFDEYGNRDYTVNEANAVVARYYDGYSVNYYGDAITSVTRYDIDGKELYTTFKNITYNDDGTIDEVKDADDVVVEKYHYKFDDDGNKIIDYVEKNMDFEYGIKTYLWYQDGKPMYVTSTKERPMDNTSENILKLYYWSLDGTTLEATCDKKSGVTMAYDAKQDVVYEIFNERMTSKNIYDKGQLIAKWDAQKHELTIYNNEREWIGLALPEEPSADSIRAVMSFATAINDEIAANKVKAENGEETSSPELTRILQAYGLIPSNSENINAK